MTVNAAALKDCLEVVWRTMNAERQHGTRILVDGFEQGWTECIQIGRQNSRRLISRLISSVVNGRA